MKELSNFKTGSIVSHDQTNKLCWNWKPATDSFSCFSIENIVRIQGGERCIVLASGFKFSYGDIYDAALLFFDGRIVLCLEKPARRPDAQEVSILWKEC